MSVEKHKAGICRWMTETKPESRTESLLSSSGLCRSMEQLHRPSGWSHCSHLLEVVEQQQQQMLVSQIHL